MSKENQRLTGVDQKPAFLDGLSIKARDIFSNLKGFKDVDSKDIHIEGIDPKRYGSFDRTMNGVTRFFNKTRIELVALLALSGCSGIVYPIVETSKPAETASLPSSDSTKTPQSPTDANYELTSTPESLATQELTLVPETEVATETATITLTPETTLTSTVETVPINMDEVIDMTKLSPEQIVVVNAEMIKRVERFKKGEICGNEILKEYGFYSKPGLVEIEPHFGILAASEFSIDFQGCILGGFLQKVKEEDGRENENLYLMVGYQNKPNGDRKVTLIKNEIGKLLMARYIYRIQYIHGANFTASSLTNYDFTTKNDILAFWNSFYEKPVTFELGLVEYPSFTTQDIEYLKSVGTDTVLLEQTLKNYNLSIKQSKDLAFDGYCENGEIDAKYEYICGLNSDNPPIGINSFTDALTLMDDGLLPITNIWKVRGAGPQY